jgi:aryl-alcohol dehydrogenase-like predicted oxidoreductase
MLGSLPAGVQREVEVTMQYRKLGTTGVSVSELCLGTMMFGAPTDQKRSNDWSQQVRA